MFLSLYFLLSKCKGAAAEYERSCGCLCPLYMKRSRIQPLSMKAQAPHCIITPSPYSTTLLPVVMNDSASRIPLFQA